jgi:GNAT superfamily N-acetyltransferase
VEGCDRARWQVTTGRQDPGTVERLLGALPGWFGIPAANVGYVESARELPTYLACPTTHDAADAEPVGVLLARRHFAQAAEIHLLAVEPSLHRHGIGRALVSALEADLVADGCILLQVKTLGPSNPDAGYARTRKFYATLGFWPLEELLDLWSPDNPCLLMVKVLAQSTASSGKDGTALARTTSA